MNYNPLEIATIIRRCNSEAEVLDACARFKYLISNTGQKYKQLLERLSCRRIVNLSRKES